MPNTKNILILESDAAMRFALKRVSLGSEIALHVADPVEWPQVNVECSLAIVNDSLLVGSGEKLPLTLVKERFNCPVILMTTTGNRRIEGFARDAGASSVLFKPFAAGELRRQIGKMMGGVDIAPAVSHETPSDNGGTQVFRPVEFGGQIAGEQVFDSLFIELEKRQPLEEGLDAFDVVERHLVKRALLTTDGNQSRAARFLGITRNTLRKRIKKYGFTSLLAGDDAGESDDE